MIFKQCSDSSQGLTISGVGCTLHGKIELVVRGSIICYVQAICMSKPMVVSHKEQHAYTCIFRPICDFYCEL